jgi:hypothetical protein
VLELLRRHPRYAESFAPKLDAVAEAGRDCYLLMLAARWPDDVRRGSPHHRGPWHYVNYPLVSPEDDGHLVPPEPKPTDENVVTMLRRNLEIAADEKADPGERAVALCWAFHLVGDVHQPLHAVSLFSRQYPDGDRGGNLFFVRVKPESAVINLHSLWDGLILGSRGYRDAVNEAIALRTRPEFARENLTELAERDVERWAKESWELARTSRTAAGRSPGAATGRTGRCCRTGTRRPQRPRPSGGSCSQATGWPTR